MANAKEEKRVFEVDGTKYAVVRPNMEVIIKADELRNKTFNDELEAGTIVREQLDEVLRRRKLWSDEREARFKALRQEVIDGEYKLSNGGIKLSEAKAIAISMRKKREDMVEMLSARTQLDSNTCEGRADAIRFNYLFANSLVYEDTGEPYFKNGLEDYLINQDDEVAEQGASEFFYLISNTDDSDSKLAENKFLTEYGFANDEGQLVDKDGRLVDEEGRHIDEFGNYIKWVSDSKYVKVDIEGRPLNDEGEFDVEFKPFLDDEGNPIVKEEKKPEKKKTTRARTKKQTTEEE